MIPGAFRVLGGTNFFFRLMQASSFPQWTVFWSLPTLASPNFLTPNFNQNLGLVVCLHPSWLQGHGKGTPDILFLTFINHSWLFVSKVSKYSAVVAS